MIPSLNRFIFQFPKILWILVFVFLSACGESSKYTPQFTTEFPFFGAGNASRFESIGLTIYFKDRPSDDQKEKILALLPADYSADYDDFQGKFLHLYLELGYNGIEAQYHGDFNKLNTTTEEALLKINKLIPIVFASRAEDTEASGTQFSKWHETSQTYIEYIVSNIEKELRLEKINREETNSLREYLEEAYNLYGLDTKGFKKELWNPKEDLRKKYSDMDLKYDVKNNLKKVISILNKSTDHGLISDILYRIVKNNYVQEGTFYKIFKSATNEKLLFHLIAPSYAVDILDYAQRVNDTETLKFFDDPELIVSLIQQTTWFYGFDDTNQLTKYGKTILPRAPIGVSADISTKVFSDLLYVLVRNLASDNPIDKNLTQQYLAMALPYSKQEPNMYSELACINSAIMEVEKAYTYLKKTMDVKLSKTTLTYLLKHLKESKTNCFDNLKKDKQFPIFLESYEKEVQEIIDNYPVEEI